MTRFWRVLDVELLWFQSSWMLHSGVVVSGTGLQLAPQGVWYRPKHGWVWGRFQCNLTTTKTLSTGKLELLVSQRRKHVNGRGQLKNETHLEGEWCVWWLVPYLVSWLGLSPFTFITIRKKILRPVVPHYDDTTDLRTVQTPMIDMTQNTNFERLMFFSWWLIDVP